MTAPTPSTVYAVTPLAGITIGNKGSTPTVAVLTKVAGSNGYSHIYLKAVGTLASTAVITAGDAGSAIAAASAGVSTYSVDCAGGVVVGQYFWAKSKAI